MGPLRAAGAPRPGGDFRGLGNILYLYYNSYMAAILVKDIPDELRNLFKALCAEQGKTMREGIIELMREVVENRRKVRR
jgi:hypothetical protein